MVIIEDIPLAAFVPQIRKCIPGAPIAVRSHNVFVKGFAGAERVGNLIENWAWRTEQKKIARLERSACESVDRVWAISKTDCQEYQHHLSFRPHGVFGACLDTARYAAVKPGPTDTAIFLGGVDHRRKESLTRFLEHVWPAVRKEIPHAQMLLAGRRMEQFANAGPGIKISGYVDDERLFLGKGAIFINPQLIGSGVKLKTIVAMLAGKAVVSTPTGIEGVPGADGIDYLVTSSTLDDMGGKIAALMKDPQRCLEMGCRARASATTNYSLDTLRQQVRPLLDDFSQLAINCDNLPR